MQANDVRLIRVFTTNKPGASQDPTPNALGGTRMGEFYLVIAAESGDGLGEAEAPYTLITSAASTSGGMTTFARRRDVETVTAGKFGWTDLGAHAGYAKLDTLMVPVERFPVGDAYRFTVTLLAAGGIVSTLHSNEFVIV
ncbi:hypothetical protein [Spirillospora sp. NPDC029432]|uniref:hypothetical protein n=1 Tax=Spirillospora sp. NPDC029432 TaxID=3154599 RepID=UPI0034527779